MPVIYRYLKYEFNTEEDLQTQLDNSLAEGIHKIALGKIANSALTKKVDHLHVTHPSAILQSIHQDYERQKFILAVKEYLNG